MSANPAAPAVAERRLRSFEELFESQRQVSNRRKKYPRKNVEALIAWLVGDGETLATAARELLRAEASGRAEDFSVVRQNLVDSKEDLVRAADMAQNLTSYMSVLHDYIGGDAGLVILQDDIARACLQHEEWFSSLALATRRTTASVVALQNLLSQKWLGSEAAAGTAASLTAAWGAAEEAIDAERDILADSRALRAVHGCAQMAMASAEKLKNYLSRTKDDYRMLQNPDLCLQHLVMFPELQSDDDFLNHLEETLGLTLSFDDGNDGRGSPYVVDVGAGLPDFKRLARHANTLSQRGVAIPTIILQNFKLCARYAAHSGMDLKEFAANYEVTEHFLTRLWAALASAAAEFRWRVGRQHGAISEKNIFVDAMTERITLGAHAISLDHLDDGGSDADVPALFSICEDLGHRHGVAFKPGSSLKFRVECDSCSSLCTRSTTCPAEKHHFCEECIGNLMSSQTDHRGAMKPIACPMGCGSTWSDLDLLRHLPRDQAEQAQKRRRVHVEMELRQQIRQEILAEMSAAQRASNDDAGNELPQALVNESLELLVDKCRGCGAAFDDQWDGCFALECPCGRHVCAYCLMLGSHEEVHLHIGSNECPVRRQMFPNANFDFFHQGGGGAREEFMVARRIRIVDDLHSLFQRLPIAQRRLLAERIRKDVEDNHIDFGLVHDVDEQL